MPRVRHGKTTKQKQQQKKGNKTMACTPNKCGVVKTDFGPLGPVTVTRTEDGLRVGFADVVAEATTKLQEAVDNAKKEEPDPDMAECEGDNCACAGLVCTPRPPDSVPFTVTFTFNGISYQATTNVVRTISDCVGRCAPKDYHMAFASIPEINLTVALARQQPISQAELTKVGEVFRSSRERKG
jgi:hypothetical protein